MKKTLIALAAVAATGAAFAQSSVTIDGFVTLGVENVDALSADAKAGTVKKTDGVSTLNAANGANQVRFRGTEDLGGGLKANFILAQRFSPESGGNDGTANKRPTFQGESTVGLSGGFGSVKLGRALTAFQGPVNTTDPWGTWTVGSTAVLTAGYATDPNGNIDGSGAGRTDAIFYSSPNFNGLSFGLSLGLKASGTTNDVSADLYTCTATTCTTSPATKDNVVDLDAFQAQSKTGNKKNLVSLWGSYASGPVYIGGGYEQNREEDDVTAVLATYNFGAFTLGAGYGKVDLSSGNSLKNFNLMGVMPFGAVTVKAGYGQSKLDTAAFDPKTTKFALGAEYRMSKRTYLYTTVARSKVSTALESKSGTGFDLGVSHSF